MKKFEPKLKRNLVCDAAVSISMPRASIALKYEVAVAIAAPCSCTALAPASEYGMVSMPMAPKSGIFFALYEAIANMSS